MANEGQAWVQDLRPDEVDAATKTSSREASVDAELVEA